MAGDILPVGTTLWMGIKWFSFLFQVFKNAEFLFLVVIFRSFLGIFLFFSIPGPFHGHVELQHLYINLTIILLNYLFFVPTFLGGGGGFLLRPNSQNSLLPRKMDPLIYLGPAGCALN